MTWARVIGLGQPAAGDDGVGWAVVRALQTRAPDGVQLLAVTEPTAVMDLMMGALPVVVVDAVVGLSVGDVVDLEPAALARGKVRTVSSHGVDLVQVMELARVLAGDRALAAIRIVGVGIGGGPHGGMGLSREVRAAVPRAVERVGEVLMAFPRR